MLAQGSGQIRSELRPEVYRNIIGQSGLVPKSGRLPAKYRDVQNRINRGLSFKYGSRSTDELKVRDGGLLYQMRP